MITLGRLGALQPLTGFAAAVTAAIAGSILRNVFIEPAHMGAACEIAKPWWCGLRASMILFTHWNGLGWASLVLTLVTAAALLTGRRYIALATVTLIVAGLGITLYNASLSIVCAVAAVLILTNAVPEAGKFLAHGEAERPGER